jgi:hypothetical protein
MSKRIGREFWTRVIAEYESRAPEQTHWDFAEEWELKLTTFRSWLYRLRREQETVASDNDPVGNELALVPIEVTGIDEAVVVAGSDDGFVPLDAAFPGGMVLRFKGGDGPALHGRAAVFGVKVARMITLPSSVKIYLASQPTDMRKGFDGLMGIVRKTLREDPFSGHLFVFVSKRAV